jgi:hypothetical protein
MGHSRRSDRGASHFPSTPMDGHRRLAGRAVIRHYESFGARQFPHTRHARTTRRVNLPHGVALAASGKSERSSRASRLDEEGRYGQSSRHVRRGCDGRGGHVRRTWPARTAKSRGPGLPTLRSSSWEASFSGATGARKPGPRGERDISRKPSRRECRLIRLNLWRLPPAFFIAGGPWVRSSPGIPCALFVFRGPSCLQSPGVNASRDRVDVSTSRCNPGPMPRGEGV